MATDADKKVTFKNDELLVLVHEVDRRLSCIPVTLERDLEEQIEAHEVALNQHRRLVAQGNFKNAKEILQIYEEGQAVAAFKVNQMEALKEEFKQIQDRTRTLATENSDYEMALEAVELYYGLYSPRYDRLQKSLDALEDVAWLVQKAFDNTCCLYRSPHMSTTLVLSADDQRRNIRIAHREDSYFLWTQLQRLLVLSTELQENAASLTKEERDLWDVQWGVLKKNHACLERDFESRLKDSQMKALEGLILREEALTKERVNTLMQVNLCYEAEEQVQLKSRLVQVQDLKAELRGLKTTIDRLIEKEHNHPEEKLSAHISKAMKLSGTNACVVLFNKIVTQRENLSELRSVKAGREEAQDLLEWMHAKVAPKLANKEEAWNLYQQEGVAGLRRLTVAQDNVEVFVPEILAEIKNCVGQLNGFLKVEEKAESR